jgi:hypothetical protein
MTNTGIRSTRPWALAVLVAVAASLGACATVPDTWDDPPPATAVPDTRVYVYPAAGQSDAQMDRDRYECHLWAVKQTGFDPGSPDLAPHQRVQVVDGPPPGSGAAVGAVAGAILGAAASGPRDSGAGMLFGAVTGAILGNAAEESGRQDARQQAMDRARSQARYGLEEQASNYRRAISACLQGRQYTIR